MIDVATVLPDPRLPDPTKVGGVFSVEDLESIDRLKAALADVGGHRFRYFDDHSTLLAALQADPPQLVLNLCDTGFRNIAAHELHVPALLELLGLPYTGSPPESLAICFDKANVRAIAADVGLAVPAQLALAPGEELAGRDVPLPAIVKPNRADGGLGITAASVVYDREALERRIAALRVELPGHTLLVQEFLAGDELGVGLLGNPGDGIRLLPPLVVDWSELPPELPRILGYESKTLPDSPYWQRLRFRSAAIDHAVLDELVARLTVLFARLRCRDYARFDLRAGADGRFRLLEVNPNPAWCWDGKLNFMAGFEGTTYSGLLDAILAAARRRIGL